MTVQPGRRLSGLTFDQVEAEVKREYELVEKGEEFEDNLHQIKVYRVANTAYDPQQDTARGFLDRDFSRADYRAEDWIFHDTTPIPGQLPVVNFNELMGDTFTRDQIRAAVAWSIGRFYYSNPDAPKIVPEIMRVLGSV